MCGATREGLLDGFARLDALLAELDEAIAEFDAYQLWDLDGATSRIADELSKQYYLGYPASGKKDGMWHSIRVEVRSRDYRVRARRGYVAGTS